MSFELNMILKTTMVLIIAGIAALALKRASASTRHTLWVVALWAALALPPASYMLPKMDLPVYVEDPVVNRLPVVWPEAVETFLVQLDAPQTLTVGEPPPAPAPTPWSWQQRLSILWGLGSLIVVIRSLLGILELRRLRKKSTLVLAPGWLELLAEAKKAVSISKGVELRMGDRDVAPMTWGIFHNVILLPAAATDWTLDQFRMVLLHELTHVKRNDGATQILVQIAISLYWFNPLVWYAAARIRIERERACDDQVLKLGIQADDYAHHLLQIARGIRSSLSFATVAMAHPSQLETRLLAILDSRTRRQTLSKLAVASLASSVGLLTVSMAVIQFTAIAPLVLPVLAGPASPAQSVSTQQVGVAPAIAPSIEGVVMKLGTSQPVEGALVELIGTGATFNVTTRADGRFAFSNIPADQYRLVATHSNAAFSPAEYGQRTPRGSGIPIVVSNVQTVGNARLDMAATGSITGRIVDRDGAPVTHARVLALEATYQEGQRAFSIVQAVHTNDRGDYRLYWLRPGRYFVAARPEHAQSRTLSTLVNPPSVQANRTEALLSAPITVRVLENGAVDEQVHDLVYYDGGIDPQRARPIDLASGASAGPIDISLAAGTARPRTIRGRVVDAAGAPVSGVQIGVLQQQPGPSTVSLVAPQAVTNGTFVIPGVLPSPAFAFALARTGNRPSFASGVGLTPIPAGSTDVDNLIVVMKAAAKVTGRIFLEGRPLTDNDPAFRNLNINFRAEQSASGFGFAGVGAPLFEASPLPDGTFSVDLIPGVWDYRIILDGKVPEQDGRRGYLKSVRMGSIDVLNRKLHIDSQPEGPLEIVIGFGLGTIGGRVLNNLNSRLEPAINRTVVLVPDARHRADLYRTETSDTSGAFRFRDVIPGDYKLFAWDDIEADAWTVPDVLSTYESRGKPIRIREASDETAEVTVIP